MIRIIMVVLVALVLLLQLADRVFLRTVTAERTVTAISVADATITPLKIETQEIVNNESVVAFAEKGMVKILNFRPGKLASHMEEQDIESMFISKKFYDDFLSQMEVWADTEFRLNNISIKESIVTRLRLVKSPPSIGRSFRLFEVSARASTYDRAVGDSELNTLSVRVYLVYLGPESGMGIYKIKIKTN
ncbi:hypothetical protein [Alteromonas sp. 14N.309.X.WAT.G.H12]|uniref:hypothetical protein n=1 Tax=Alteromonas sp. 14N.309.X.WAT.G.H12 TaxID=3120824 RepID=UPI002FD2FD52